jgi:lipoprotein-releasing system ATP-binding protein
MKSEIVLRAKCLSKTFLKPIVVDVLKEISLDVKRGEILAIMGKSGEGKSTLLHILGTLEKPTGGELEICGKNVQDAFLPSLRNQHIGFIFQSFNLLEDYTTLDNVLMPAKIARIPVHKGSTTYNKALTLLDQVGLSSRKGFLAKLLSGGEKQRAAIARALLNDPDLILADEPSGNLDHTNSQTVHELLINSAKKWQKTVLIVTHDRELAALCDRTLLLKDGLLYSDDSSSL